MGLDILTISLIVAYFVAVMIIGFWPSKKEDDEGYLLANRKVGTFFLTATLVASIIGGNTLVTMMSFIYTYGTSVIWAQVGIALGCFGLAGLAFKIRKLSEKHRFYTLSDYFQNRFGKFNGSLATAIIFVVYIGYLLIQFIAGGVILSALTGWSYPLSVILMGSVVTIYLAAGGFRAVLSTDAFQFIAILFIVVIAGAIFSKAGEIPASSLNVFSSSPMNIFAFLIYGIFVIIMGADMWQRVYSGKSVKVVRRALTYTGIIYFLISILIILIGLIVKSGFPNIAPNTALVVGFKEILPSYLLGVGLVVILAARRSSIDTYIFVLSPSFAKNVMNKFERLSRHDLAKVTRVVSIILGVAGMGFSIIFPNIVNVLTAIVGIYFVLFPSLILSFWFKLEDKAVSMSIIAGLVVTISAFVINGVVISSAVASLPATVIFLILGQIIFKKKYSGEN